MNGADALLQSLIDHGLTTIFGYPGGAVIPLYDALTARPEIRHVLTRHEQGAAHAAEGWAKATGKVGVCLATSGPGATNLVTGLADAMLDSVPLLAITGNVARHLLGTDAFQEADITGITLPVTKHNYLVRRADDLPRILAEAVSVASGGRPGPVLIDIPKDVQLEAFTGSFCPPRPRPSVGTVSEEYIEQAKALLRGARRPVLVVGGGAQEASFEITRLARAWNLPTITTLMGLGIFPAADPLWLGMPGMHGSVAANRSISESDLLIGVGMRFDDRVTGRISGFAPKAQIIHVDIDASELGKLVRTHLGLRGEASDVAARLAEGAEPQNLHPWWEKIREWKGRQVAHAAWGAGQAIGFLCGQLAENDILATDVGQHQMLAAQLARFQRPRRWLTSGGLGTMGFGLPAALGAALAAPDCRTVAIVGDGGFQMTMQELATLKRYDIPVKLAILNNSYLGMVRQWQEMFNDRRYSEVYIGESNPDFGILAKAYGIPSWRATDASELAGTVPSWLSCPGPALLEVVVPNEHAVFPMVPQGAALSEMIEDDPAAVQA